MISCYHDTCKCPDIGEKNALPLKQRVVASLALRKVVWVDTLPSTDRISMSMPKTLIQALPADLSEQLREQLRRLLMHFDEMRVVPPFPGAWLPALDLCELKDAIIIRVELPGVAREDIRLSLFDNLLKIEGRKQRLPESDDGEGKPLRYLCLERSNGKFERTVVLQWAVEVEKISANLRDGILEVRLPKTIACGREFEIPISS